VLDNSIKIYFKYSYHREIGKSIFLLLINRILKMSVKNKKLLTDLVYYILLTLVEPLHGYGIMQKVLEISKGEMIIGPASLYTILEKLQAAKYIELLEDDERRKNYTLMVKGKEILRKDINI